MPDRIDAYCSQPGYEQHLRPILDGIPSDIRGRLYAERNVAREIGWNVEIGTPPDSKYPLLVAGYQDMRYARRPKVLVQHGAGQTYEGSDSCSAAGGPGHEAASMFLCPSQRVADLEFTRYGKPSLAIGCPKLDQWAEIAGPGDGTVGITFHWDQHIEDASGYSIPEAGTAWPAWRDRIEEFVKLTDRPVVGHAHPRYARQLAPWWNSLGIEFIPNAIDLVVRADILVLDNSSVGFEWAAIGRHTVWLRGYGWSDRHGLRFGDPLPGPDLHEDATVDDLEAAIDEWRTLRWAFAREEVTGRVYGGPPDGYASERAVAAIMTLVT